MTMPRRMARSAAGNDRKAVAEFTAVMEELLAAAPTTPPARHTTMGKEYTP